MTPAAIATWRRRANLCIELKALCTPGSPLHDALVAEIQFLIAECTAEWDRIRRERVRLVTRGG